MPDVTLEGIERLIRDHHPPEPLFNGATRLFLGTVLYDQIVPLLTAIDRRRIAVEQRVMFHPAAGVGFRPSVADDPEWQRVPDYGTLVWTCAPSAATALRRKD